MQYIQIIKIIIQLLPLILEAIKALESMLPEGGLGKLKLEIIKSAVEAAYNVSNEYSVKFDALWPALEKVIGSIVATMNATGVFKK